MEVKASRAKPKPRKCLPFVFIYFNVFAVISVIAVISVLPCSVDGRKKILGKVKTSTTYTLGHCLNEPLMGHGVWVKVMGHGTWVMNHES